ncbi:hypothetical protein QBC32DRAFT_342493 [Pseudoneurospora amorphoporcata]|uniref:Uncharacterized protein n=1 Tax=Pseudoneurospora amorphoporcata TaxID=241081 RepID=A0AAN6NUE5_9PEZI|nr:hypothetical protein QBC32DRAFT_342493 [Pseudoneurospora amorphoporcata]
MQKCWLSPSSGVVVNAMFIVRASLVAVGALSLSLRGRYVPANVSGGRWDGNPVWVVTRSKFLCWGREDLQCQLSRNQKSPTRLNQGQAKGRL